MRIIIVEDEWLIAALIEDTLRAADIEVVGMAGSIERAIRLLDTVAPHAAVLDANLRGAAAEPVAVALAARGIPFLVISGYASDEHKGLLATAPCLRKPFTPKHLLEKVRRLVP